MPVYNHAAFVPQALAALRDQQACIHEFIALDDGSTDASYAVLRAAQAEFPQLEVIAQPENRGVVAALNTLLARATSDYVFFYAADDRVLPGFLEQSLALLAQHPGAGLCSTLVIATDASGQEQGLVLPRPRFATAPTVYLDPAQVQQAFRAGERWLLGSSVVYERAALQAAGGFMPELKSYCDGFIQEVLALRQGACFIAQPLATWRMLPGSYAAQHNTPRLEWELYLQAHHLRRTRFSDAFPPAFLAEITQDWLYHATAREWKQVLRAYERFWEHLRLRLRLAAPRWWDRLFLAGGRAASYLLRLIVGAYLRSRLHPTSGWARRSFRLAEPPPTPEDAPPA